MKKLLFAASLLICASLILSCRKNSDDIIDTPGYFINGELNGISYSYTANATAKITDRSSTGEPSSVNIVAGEDNSPEGFNLSITFFNGSSLQYGTYTEGTTGVNYMVSGAYHPDSSNFVYVAGIQPSSVKPLVIKIVSKTDTEIAGTFDGAFYKEDPISGIFYPDHISTKGVFKLPLQ